MPPSYQALCQLLGFPVPRSYARFIELTIPDADSDDWTPFPVLPFMNLNNAGPDAISITKPPDSVIFGWTGGDSEHFVFVLDDDATDDRERPIAFWPIDGRDETGLVANSFPEFLEWLAASDDADPAGSADETAQLADLLRTEFNIRSIRRPDQIVKSARAQRLKQPGLVSTCDNVGLALPPGSVDRKYLDRIDWPTAERWRSTPVPQLLDEAERRLQSGQPGTALVLARNYRFLWWYHDWDAGAEIIRRTSDLMAAAYQQIGRPLAAAEIQRQTEYNLFNVS